MEIIIKEATLNDVEALVPLFDAYRIFYKQASDTGGATKFLKERLTNKQSIIFIAFINSEAIGFTQLYPIYSSISMTNAWLLNDLFVDQKARQKGVAALLLNKAKEHGRRTNSKRLLLETSVDNFTAQALYEKNGWLKETDFFYQFALTT